MNPELQRNLWLELSPMRLLMMPAIIGLIFAAVWTTWGFGTEAQGQLAAVAAVARSLFFFIVVIWGTWISARLVTGDIRDRTWDFQRMSAISSWSMVAGKLIGGTAFIWYGGAICLVPIIMYTAATGDSADVPREILFRVGMGVFAHATAFFVSMLAVRRDAASSRLASFFAMAAGVGAAAWVWSVWIGTQDWPLNVQFTWYQIEMALPTFMVASLLVFAAWAIVGNWTLMRHELQIPTGPFVWIGFIVFAMAYYAGQADFLGILDELSGSVGAASKAAGGVASVNSISDSILASARWAIAFWVALLLAYIAILVAPKNWVQLRQIRDQFKSGRFAQALWNLPSWGYASIAALFAAVVLMTMLDPVSIYILEGIADDWVFSNLVSDGEIDLRPTVLAIFAFMIRDIGIVLWFNAAKRARRPDIAAALTIWVLHGVVPAIFAGATAFTLIGLVSPWPINGDSWMQPVWPALEAAAILFLVAARRRMVRSAG